MSETAPKHKWNEDSTRELVASINTGPDQEVTVDQVNDVADQMELSVRSIAAKLRKMGYTVASMAKTKTSAFTVEQTAALSNFVTNNAHAMTYADIAANFLDGAFSPKSIQGKILALDLTALVKPSEKQEAVSLYSADEEAKFISLASGGAFIEDIAASLGREVKSIRGKALSLLTKGLIASIPTQKNPTAKATVDVVDALGDDINTMTVAEIATVTNKTERGIKTTLTRRGIKVADYDGAAKQAKARGKEAEAA